MNCTLPPGCNGLYLLSPLEFAHLLARACIPRTELHNLQLADNWSENIAATTADHFTYTGRIFIGPVLMVEYTVSRPGLGYGWNRGHCKLYCITDDANFWEFDCQVTGSDSILVIPDTGGAQRKMMRQLVFNFLRQLGNNTTAIRSRLCKLSYEPNQQGLQALLEQIFAPRMEFIHDQGWKLRPAGDDAARVFPGIEYPPFEIVEFLNDTRR